MGTEAIHIQVQPKPWKEYHNHGNVLECLTGSFFFTSAQIISTSLVSANSHKR